MKESIKNAAGTSGKYLAWRLGDFGIPGRAMLVPAVIVMHLLGFTAEAYSVGGVSNSKINVLSADTVPRGSIEGEPYFSLVFTDDGNDSVNFGGGLRITPGLLDNLEAGASFNYLNIEDADLERTTADFADIEAGVKYKFLEQGDKMPFSLAYTAGITFPVGEGAIWVVEPVGLVLTQNFTDELSLDAQVIFAIIEHGSWSISTDAGLGYFLTSWLQAVAEGAYAFEDPDEGGGISVVNVTGGFTAPAAEWLTVILGVTPDVYAKNTDKQIVLSAAFTFSF